MACSRRRLVRKQAAAAEARRQGALRMRMSNEASKLREDLLREELKTLDTLEPWGAFCFLAQSL